jgi:hypothetical protein
VDLARWLAQNAVHIAEPLGDYLKVGNTTKALAMVHGLVGDIETGRRS